MKINDGIGWDGVVSFGIVDESFINKIGLDNFLEGVKNGNYKWKREYKSHNKVANYARSYVAQMITLSVPYPAVIPSQMELGTGTGTPLATDTNLFSPVTATAKPCSSTQTYLNYFAQYITTWLTTDPVQGNWNEIGLFDANNNLWAHAVTNITVNSGEMLVAQWAVQIIGN